MSAEGRKVALTPHASRLTPHASRLAGRRVVVTRAENQGDALSALLRDAGAEPIDYPCIAFAPPEDPAPLHDAVARLYAGAFDWLVLTSANAAQALVKAKGKRQKAKGSIEDDADAAFSIQHSAFSIAAVGPATAAAARELLGAEPTVMPEVFVAEALAEAMGDVHGQRVLLLNSAIARPALAVLLVEAGAQVERVVAYRTITASGGADVPTMLAAGAVDAITFTSGSTVRAFAERVGAAGVALARRTTIACIGPVTAQVASEHGLAPTVVATTSTAEGLVEALGAAFASTPTRPH